MLTLDEARGIAAKIWLKPNYRRSVLDPIMCDDIANLLVDEVTKAGLSPEHDQLKLDLAQAKVDLARANSTVTDFDKLRDQLASLKDHYNSLNDQYERLKLVEKQLNIEIANLRSEVDNLKLGKKDEVV